MCVHLTACVSDPASDFVQLIFRHYWQETTFISNIDPGQCVQFYNLLPWNYLIEINQNRFILTVHACLPDAARVLWEEPWGTRTSSEDLFIVCLFVFSCLSHFYYKSVLLRWKLCWLFVEISAFTGGKRTDGLLTCDSCFQLFFHRWWFIVSNRLVRVWCYLDVMRKSLITVSLWGDQLMCRPFMTEGGLFKICSLVEADGCWGSLTPV